MYIASVWGVQRVDLTPSEFFSICGHPADEFIHLHERKHSSVKLVGLHPTGLQALHLPHLKTSRKNPESVTETSVVYWTGDFMCPKKGPQGTPQPATLCDRGQAGHGISPP